MPSFAKDTVTNRNCTRHRRVVGGAIALFLAFSQIVAASTHADDQSRGDERNAIRRMNEQTRFEMRSRSCPLLHTPVHSCTVPFGRAC
jgi:hypothetical protein